MITNEECVFADGESTKTIKIGIIDDDQPEEVSVGAGTNYLVEPRSRGGAGLWQRLFMVAVATLISTRDLTTSLIPPTSLLRLQDEHFFCQLTAIEGCALHEEQSKTKIVIVDDDEPGQMGFDAADAKVIVSERYVQLGVRQG